MIPILRSYRFCSLGRTMVLCAAFITLAASCRGGTGDGSADAAAVLPQWTFDSSMVFPDDGSLIRPEDGVALAGGSLIVADQVHGLRRIEVDGSGAPFGEMVSAGYMHNPPGHSGGANGVSLEPAGTHLLVADVFHGGIYRVEVATGASELVYQHRYGVNTAVRDSRGAIWFTQSAHNTPEEGEARMWAAVETGQPEGALLRLGMQGDRLAADAELLVDSLFFANGLAIDEAGGHLYVAETVAGRVLRFRMDLATGQLSERTVVVDSISVDNLELDGADHLWMAVPLSNELMVVSTTTGDRHSAFRVQTPDQQARVAEITRRSEAGEPVLELFGPDLWAPLPGLVTGMVVSPGGGPIYLTGLGNALVRLPR